MEFKGKNLKLKIMLLILIVFLAITTLATAYFIKREISKNTNIKNTANNNNEQALPKVKPLTPEQIKETFLSSGESADNNNDVEKSVTPLNPEQVNKALSRTTNKTSTVPNNIQPLSSEEIETALKKTK